VSKITLDNVEIDYVQEYLGVHLYRRLNWSGHCETMRTKAPRTLGQFIPPSAKVKIIYLTYASSAWAVITKTQFFSLQVVQNRALRVIGGYVRHTRTDKMHLNHQISILKSYVNALTLKMYASAKRTEIGIS
jgi:hypothetical protein